MHLYFVALRRSSFSECFIESSVPHLLPFCFLGLRQNKQTYNPADTNALVAAVAFGKGLSNRRPPGPGGPMVAGQAGASGMLQGAASMQQGSMSMQPNQQQHMTGVPMAQAGQPGIGLLWSTFSVFYPNILSL